VIEKIKIDKCPICSKSHTYKLEVERDQLIGMITLESSQYETIKFMRIFSCPKNGSVFKAKITLYQTPISKIKAVKIRGISNETQDN